MTNVMWRGERIPRLVLGTAQFGGPYGIGNVAGKPDCVQCRKIVSTAWAEGVRLFDTAQDYGDAESALGDALGALGREASGAVAAGVVTKLSPSLAPTDAGELVEALRASCGRLRAQPLWAVLVHCPEWLEFWEQGLRAALCRARDEGLVRHIGASVYTAYEARRAIALPDLDVVQAPCNAWDQRLARNGLLEEAKQRGKLVFVRSIFLQGLLAMRPEAVAGVLPQVEPVSREWQALVKERSMRPGQLAARYAASLGVPLVFGAESPEQVAETAEWVREGALSRTTIDEIYGLLRSYLDESVLDPRRWGDGSRPALVERGRTAERGRTVALIQARMGSTRLPGKLLAPIVAGKGALELMAERACRAELLDEVAVATTMSPGDAPVVELCERLGVRCFRGNEEDVLDRYYRAAQAFGPASVIVRLTGDCPLCDPEVVDACVRLHQAEGADYTSNVEPPTYPDGLDVEVCTFAALETVWREATRPSDREHVTPYLRRNPAQFRQALLKSEQDHSIERWTLDEEQDLEFLRCVFAQLYAKTPAFLMADVLRLLEQHPEIRALNQGIPRNAGYLKSLTKEKRL